MTERMEAYRSYFDEVTANGNTRMENITLCAGHRDEHRQHIKIQVTLAFYGGWRLATEHVDALLKAEREKALREAAAICPTAIKSYGMLKPGKPNQFASREAQIVAKGFARLIEEDILALISKDDTP